MKLGDLEIDLIVKTAQASAGGKKAKEELAGVEASAKKTKAAVDDLGQSGGSLSQMFNLNQVAAGAAAVAFLYFAQNSIKLGAELINLKAGFAGTAQDLDLLRKATAGTVGDGGLIKLSNHASDLGLSLEEQAQAFSLAEDRADKYGGSIESNFEAIVMASDGMSRGLRSLGVSTADFETKVNDLAAAQGKQVKEMSDAEARATRLSAVFELTGTSLESVNNKTIDAADLLGQLALTAEETAAAFGEGFVNALYNSEGGVESFSETLQGLKSVFQDVGQSAGEFFSDVIHYTKLVVNAISDFRSWLQSLDFGKLNLGSRVPTWDEQWKEVFDNDPTWGQTYGPGDDKGVDRFNKEMERRGKYGKTKPGSSTSKGTTKKEQEDELTYLARLQKELTDLQAVMAQQTSVENLFSGLTEKEKDLERVIWLVQNWRNVITAPLPDAATIPGTGPASLGTVQFDDFLLKIEAWRKERQEAEQSFDRILSGMEAASVLAGEIAGKLSDGGESLFSYIQKALALAIQIAQVTNKDGDVSFADFLPILGTLISFIPFSSGGSVPGQGSGDSVPAMLEPGEFVIRRSRAQQLGDRMLNWLNGGGPVLSRSVPHASAGGDLIIQFSGEMTPEMKYKIVDDGQRFRNVRVANSTY